MIRAIRFLLLSTLCTTILIPLTAAHSRANPAPPFIYYYSAADQAFNVERADGTDSHVLAPYEIPLLAEGGPPYQVAGPGWSPSGEWLAWHTVHPWYHSNVGNQVYVISREGGAPQLLLDDQKRIIDLAWSPAADHLLIWRRAEGHDNDAGRWGEIGLDDVTVYDMTTQQILWQRTAQELHAVYNNQMRFAHAAWTPNGDAVALVFFRVEAPDAPVEGVLQLISAETTVERAIYLPPPGHDCDFITESMRLAWSPDGKLLYTTPDEKTLVIEDFATGDNIAIPAPDNPVFRVDWSPDGDHALVYTTFDCRGVANYHLWLLSMLDYTLTQLPGAGVSRQDQWVQPPPYLDWPPYPTTTWSPTGTHATYASDNRLFLYLLDTQTLTVTPIIAETGYVVWDSLRWSADGAHLHFVYHPPDEGWQVRRYDVASGAITVLADANCQMYSPIRGPHLFCSNPGVNVAHYTNLATGVQIELPYMDTQVAPALLHIYFALWHPVQDWFFWTAYIDAGGGGSAHRLTIANPDFSGYRELGYCYLDEPSCFGWLPEM